MKTRIVLILIAIVTILCWLIPETSWSQLPIDIKRSNELTRIAVRLFQEHKFDRAKEQLAKALQLNPKNILAHELSAFLYYQEHNFQRAKKHAKLAIQFNEKAPRAHYVIGMINFQQGNYDLARIHLKQAVGSLKDPEYRSRAKNILEKISEKSKNKNLTEMEKKRKVPDQVVQVQTQQLEYKPYVAVFPFEDANAKTEQTKLGQTLTEMLITALIQTDKFTVMERVQLEKILTEQSLSQAGIIDIETAVEVGKLSGLAGVVMGSISQLKTSIEADARLIDVETGKALTAANAMVTNVDDIRSLANSLAKQLAAKSYLIVSEPDTIDAKY